MRSMQHSKKIEKDLAVSELESYLIIFSLNGQKYSAFLFMCNKCEVNQNLLILINYSCHLYFYRNGRIVVLLCLPNILSQWNYNVMFLSIMFLLEVNMKNIFRTLLFLSNDVDRHSSFHRVCLTTELYTRFVSWECSR